MYYNQIFDFNLKIAEDLKKKRQVRNDYMKRRSLAKVCGSETLFLPTKVTVVLLPAKLPVREAEKHHCAEQSYTELSLCVSVCVCASFKVPLNLFFSFFPCCCSSSHFQLYFSAGF